ncbi:ead/Ea22-like family protein, partial [Escherichia coli]|uniref:ead/Ea22-like family protein n=2 Tax=Escherichia coli TaxID=562 RepID=UPI0035A8183A
MSNIDKQALREIAAAAVGAHERLSVMPPDDIFDISLAEGTQLDADITALNALNSAANPTTVLALLDELEAKDKQISLDVQIKARLCRESNSLHDRLRVAEKRIAELEATQGKPVMFIDGDISPADADKLAAVIREFNEETETPAARMARIIRENPHPTNMCDMPAAAAGKGE